MRNCQRWTLWLKTKNARECSTKLLKLLFSKESTIWNLWLSLTAVSMKHWCLNWVRVLTSCWRRREIVSSLLFVLLLRLRFLCWKDTRNCLKFLTTGMFKITSNTFHRISDSGSTKGTSSQTLTRLTTSKMFPLSWKKDRTHLFWKTRRQRQPASGCWTYGDSMRYKPIIPLPVSALFYIFLLWKYRRSIVLHSRVQFSLVCGSSRWRVEYPNDRFEIFFLWLRYYRRSFHLFCLAEAIFQSCRFLRIIELQWRGRSHLDACWNAIFEGSRSSLESRRLEICLTTILSFSFQLTKV